jgi:predicted ATP-dependent endonuclease of OLD family
MADLSDRIMRADPRYGEIESAVATIRRLLNPSVAGEQPQRLEALAGVEATLRDTVKRLMPSVNGVQIGVEVEESKDIFSKGVTVKIDDGVLTDVLDKGHGMQRSIVFAMLQMLMKSSNEGKNNRPIILGIEEPELYIHPHAQRLIYGVLREFAGFAAGDADTATGTDQVLYTTHCPAFIDISRYERVGVVRKEAAAGTIVRQCDAGVLGSVEERKGFKLLTCFGLKHNELFFARYCILVEGPEDEVGIIATARKLGGFVDLPDEIGLSIVVTDGKGDIPKFQKVLNAFGLSYGVLLELDGQPETHKQTAPILENLNGNRCKKVPNRVEDILGVGGHFKDQRHAKEFFSDPTHINEEMENVVKAILPEVG